MKKLLLLFFFCCLIGCKDVYHHFNSIDEENVFSRIDIADINDELRDACVPEITYAKKYVAAVISNYREACFKAGLNKKFYDSMPLFNPKKVSADLFYSDTRDIVIYVFQADDNVLHVHGSHLPAQTAAIHPELRFIAIDRLNSFYHRYDTTKAAIELTNSGDLSFDYLELGGAGSDLKMFGLHRMQGPVFFHDLKVYSHNWEDGTIQYVIFNGSGFGMASDKTTLKGFAYTGTWYAEEKAKKDIRGLFFKSEFFREVTAHDNLNPMAKSMLVKYERSKVDAGFHYDSLDFINDVRTLEDSINAYHIKLKSKDILNSVRYQIRPGILLWFYSSYREYTIQWLIAGIVVLLLSILFKYKRLAEKGWGEWFKAGSFLVMAVFVVEEGFRKMPVGMNIKYWIWPCLVILATYAVLFIWKREMVQVKK